MIQRRRGALGRSLGQRRRSCFELVLQVLRLLRHDCLFCLLLTEPLLQVPIPVLQEKGRDQERNRRPGETPLQNGHTSREHSPTTRGLLRRPRAKNLRSGRRFLLKTEKSFGKRDFLAPPGRSQIGRFEFRLSLSRELSAHVAIHQIVLSCRQLGRELVVSEAQFVQTRCFFLGQRSEKITRQELMIRQFGHGALTIVKTRTEKSFTLPRDSSSRTSPAALESGTPEYSAYSS